MYKNKWIQYVIRVDKHCLYYTTPSVMYTFSLTHTATVLLITCTLKVIEREEKINSASVSYHTLLIWQSIQFFTRAFNT